MRLEKSIQLIELTEFGFPWTRGFSTQLKLGEEFKFQRVNFLLSKNDFENEIIVKNRTWI